MAMRISYQNLLQRLVVSKKCVQTVSYMKFLNTISIMIMKWKVYIDFSPAVGLTAVVNQQQTKMFVWGALFELFPLQ